MAIEINGISHSDDDNYHKDISRQKKLEDLGIVFIRINGLEVLNNIEGIQILVKEWINEDLNK